MSFVVLVESYRLKECVAYLFSFHISKNKKNTLFKGAKVPSPLKEQAVAGCWFKWTPAALRIFA